jgi:hypothetical protein
MSKVSTCSNSATKARTHVHQALQVVDVDIAHHVGFADTEVRRSEHPCVKEVVVDREPDGVSTLLERSEAVDAL